MYPTEYIEILKLQNLVICVFELHKISRSTVFEALKF